jgi:ABC-2 type transport system permease protein
MKKLLKYEFQYLQKTSKFIVFGAVFVLFSILSPLTARYMNEILAYLLASDDSIIFQAEDPTVFTSYGQYLSDLYEVVFIVILFVAVSVFIRDKTKGLLPLIFSKPINRTKYVLSKYISFLVLLAVSIIIGYIVFSYYTYFLFDDVFIVRGIYMMLLYFLDMMFVTAIALFCATQFKSYLPAIAVSWGIYLFTSILTIAENTPIIKHFPGMIKSNIVSIIYETSTTSDIIWNIVVTSLIITGLIGLTIRKIRHSDI